MRSAEPAFTTAGIVIALTAIPLMAAFLIDNRTLADVNIWSKPLKFHLSLSIYLLTLAWFARWLPQGLIAGLRYRIYRNIVIFCIVAELVWIVGAATFGVGSHFNQSNLLMAITYPLMGISAVILTSASLVYAINIFRSKQHSLNGAFRLALALGLGLTFLLTLIVAGYMSAQDSHLVYGNQSDLERLPVLGWSRDGGDLRVAHFFATHAMHVIPILGWVASRCMTEKPAKLNVWLISVLYVSLVGFTFAQAMGGKPFLY